MAEQDNLNFDRVLKLAAIFDRHMDEDQRVVSWKKMKVEIEALSEIEQEMLLGLVKTMKEADASE